MNSAIVYRGPSRLHKASNIVAVVTGLKGDSANPKTGPMAQLWILRDDMSPLAAIDQRADYAICGDCPLRGSGNGDRACYVSVHQAPNAVYRALDKYPEVEPSAVNAILRQRGLRIRLGAYGEPVALPIYVLRDLTNGVRHTGYTHQWRQNAQYQDLLMASCDTEASFLQAINSGWRAFRSRTADEPLMPHEIVCPASDEAGHKTTCERCTLCDGKVSNSDARKHVAIVVHGSGKSHYLEFRK